MAREGTRETEREIDEKKDAAKEEEEEEQLGCC